MKLNDSNEWKTLREVSIDDEYLIDNGDDNAAIV